MTTDAITPASVTVSVDPEVREYLQSLAKEHGLSVADIVKIHLKDCARCDWGKWLSRRGKAGAAGGRIIPFVARREPQNS